MRPAETKAPDSKWPVQPASADANARPSAAAGVVIGMARHRCGRLRRASLLPTAQAAGAAPRRAAPQPPRSTRRSASFPAATASCRPSACRARRGWAGPATSTPAARCRRQRRPCRRPPAPRRPPPAGRHRRALCRAGGCWRRCCWTTKPARWQGAASLGGGMRARSRRPPPPPPPVAAAPLPAGAPPGSASGSRARQVIRAADR